MPSHNDFQSVNLRGYCVFIANDAAIDFANGCAASHSQIFFSPSSAKTKKSRPTIAGRPFIYMFLEVEFYQIVIRLSSGIYIPSLSLIPNAE